MIRFGFPGEPEPLLPDHVGRRAVSPGQQVGLIARFPTDCGEAYSASPPFVNGA